MTASTTSTSWAFTPPSPRPPAKDSAGRVAAFTALPLRAALVARGHLDLVEPIFALAGAAEWLHGDTPDQLPEARVARLHHEIRAALGEAEGDAVLGDAGRRAAEHILATRIPGLLKWLLLRLPTRLSATALTGVIRLNAWTFAGTGGFEGRVGRTAVFILQNNPLCAGEVAPGPMCAWHAALIETLFRALVSARTVVTETQCEAAGAPCCRFEADWAPGSRG